MFCDNFVSRVSLLHFLGGREKESKEEDDRTNEEDDTVYSLKTGQTRFSIRVSKLLRFSAMIAYFKHVINLITLR